MAGKPRARARAAGIASGEFLEFRPYVEGEPPTEPQMQVIEKWLAAGDFFETSAAFAGVPGKVARAWLRKGCNENEGIYFEFACRVKLAKEKAIALALRDVKEASRRTKLVETKEDAEGKVTTTTKEERGDWRAAAWRLEKLDPKRFSLKVRVEIEREIDAVFGILDRLLADDPNRLTMIYEEIAKLAETSSSDALEDV